MIIYLCCLFLLSCIITPNPSFEDFQRRCLELYGIEVKPPLPKGRGFSEYSERFASETEMISSGINIPI